MKVFLAWVSTLAAHLVLLGLVYTLNTKLGQVPPLGKLMNPFSGFWQNAEPTSAVTKPLELFFNNAKVRVEYDEMAIPTISSDNYFALFYAQGYCTAGHRLWQMELQTRAAAGRLSEIIGERTVEYDRFMRRIGMSFGAEQSLKGMMADDTTRQIVEAYSAGVNAYINTLTKATLPLEYKILDHEPEPWTPLKCALLLKYMAFDLSFYNEDATLLQLRAKLGSELIELLFPNYPYVEQPIVTGGKWLFQPVNAANTGTNVELDGAQSELQEPNKGSNNWAISGSKTANGFALLANDPHLNMSLPSLWYVCRMKHNAFSVAGASLPGAPGVIIGFNQHLSWGVTNGYADVADWYYIDWVDKQNGLYQAGNDVLKAEKRVESILIRGKAVLVDTVNYTQFGPIVADNKNTFQQRKSVPVNMACRWVAHDESNELKTFSLINQAKNIDQFQAALEYYACPAQNFVYADKAGNIAIFPNTGKIPARKQGFGKYPLSSSDSQAVWQNYIPRSHIPKQINPISGFVFSANQQTTTPDYPYYLNWDFGSPDRAIRIHERLLNMQNATVDTMRLLQMDDMNVFARYILPFLLTPIAQKSTQLSESELKVYNELHNWDFRHQPHAVAPTLFQQWWGALNDTLWTNKFGLNGLQPRRWTVAWLLKHGDVATKTKVGIPVNDALNEYIYQSFKTFVRHLLEKHNQLEDGFEALNWAKVKNTHIDHLGRIPGMGTGYLETGGSKSSINAMSERNGPSWRMVVELSAIPQGYGIYPGGQSGNPGSKHYDNMVELWRKGELLPLSLP